MKLQPDALRTVALAFFILFSSIRMAAAGTGDISGDGKVNNTDCYMLRGHLLKTTTLSSAQQARADMNNDGKADIADLVKMAGTYLWGSIYINVTPDNAGWTLIPSGNNPAISGTGDRLAGAVKCPIGSVTFRCNPLAGYATPADQVLTVTKDQPVTVTAVYTPVTPSGIQLVDVPAGTFTMGNSGRGDDLALGLADEVRHQVTLSAYQIGRYEFSAGECCMVLNWANAKGYLKNSSGGAYTGGSVYGYGKMLIGANSYDQIVYSNGAFASKSREGAGGVMYSLEAHPMVNVTWYGAVAVCNWLSEKEGLTPAYNLANWTLTVPYTNGYRLPTESEWERAAAWDAITQKHWIYGFQSDTLTDYARCSWNGFNPLGLTVSPWTCPGDWFNGMHVSPNENVSTTDSASPVGCYNMSGNVWEWCHDIYGAYPTTPVTDPTGPASGSSGRCLRGGNYGDPKKSQRTALRDFVRSQPTRWEAYIGFRVARKK
ncbi:MAG: SUMF1/EgtB/PvdO family nonheme iron enzyme [Candidatus Sumerlaeia bacterium]